jgi:hypothetical protein
MEKLYYIENIGCDDTTHGLVRISDEDFPKFKSFVENLNKNSTYGCMPTIEVYEISEDQIRLATEEDEEDCDWELLYLDDKKYVTIERWASGKLNRVI